MPQFPQGGGMGVAQDRAGATGENDLPSARSSPGGATEYTPLWRRKRCPEESAA